MTRDSLAERQEGQQPATIHLLAPSVLSLGLALVVLSTMERWNVGISVARHHTCWARVNSDSTDYATVQAAVDAAQDGDLVKVAGYCSGVESRANVSQTVYISKSITLRGGYTVTDWTVPDPVAHTTVLDAEQRGRGLTIVSPATDPGEKLSVTVEGLRITGGDADGLGGGQFGSDVGGGLYVNTVTATIRGNQISHNTAQRGGGLHLTESSVKLGENDVISNSADWDGGGLYVLKGTTTLFENMIAGNVSQNGGGVNIQRSDFAALRDNTVVGNRTSHTGAGLHIDQSTVTLTGNEVTSNTAGEDGGGLSLDVSTALVVQSTFQDNRAGEYGGGICVRDSDGVTVTDSLILGNTSLEDGGGLHLDTSDVTLSDSLIKNNAANDDGGGLYIFRARAATIRNSEFVWNTAQDKGGAIHLREGDLSLFNGILAANTAHRGSGVYLDNASGLLVHATLARNEGQSGICLIGQSTAALTNTILASHTVGIDVTGESTATLAATLWGKGAWANQEDWGGEGAVQAGSRNHWDNPVFKAPDAGDYRIGPGSGALDRGLSTGISSDIDGDPRPLGPAPDLGADEIWQVHLPLTLR